MARDYVLRRVIDRTLCVENGCRSCLYSLFPTTAGVQEVECNRADCDNHLRPDEDELPPNPSHSLVVQVQPELPFSPE